MLRLLSYAARCAAGGLLLSWAAGACWAQAQPMSHRTVFVSLAKASEPFMTKLRIEAEDEAKKLGLQLVFEDGKGDSAVQSAGLEAAALNGKIHGVVIAPNDVHALATAVNFALARGLPVITVDRKVEGTRKPVPHVGVDNVLGGRLLAQWVVSRFPKGATVLHLTGQPGSSSAIDRAKGVRDALAAAGPTYRLVGDVSANWSRTEAVAVTERQLNFLKQPPDVILAANDDMALGALEAIDNMGLRQRGIQVLGYDALPQALQKVREGKLAATADQHADRLSRIALAQMDNLLRTAQPLATVILTPVLVTPETLAATQTGK
jgi:inositol transport system substrate-binding protein